MPLITNELDAICWKAMICKELGAIINRSKVINKLKIV